ncbi:hypothetical protein B0O80DRAFT_135843 [Mortierella sp. GBAus27b]|nr:hypothetical protein BGX31_007707 [Mortierella sp. GBA43]KAI8350009.1 hypothetical protein B0O80DRAFT_135843 [Mortierella sp. GBAus27b]
MNPSGPSSDYQSDADDIFHDAEMKESSEHGRSRVPAYRFSSTSLNAPSPAPANAGMTSTRGPAKKTTPQTRQIVEGIVVKQESDDTEDGLDGGYDEKTTPTQRRLATMSSSRESKRRAEDNADEEVCREIKIKAGSWKPPPDPTLKKGGFMGLGKTPLESYCFNAEHGARQIIQELNKKRQSHIASMLNLLVESTKYREAEAKGSLSTTATPQSLPVSFERRDETMLETRLACDVLDRDIAQIRSLLKKAKEAQELDSSFNTQNGNHDERDEIVVHGSRSEATITKKAIDYYWQTKEMSDRGVFR